MTELQSPPPFLVNDCTLAAIATGTRVQTLIEFRDKLATVNPSSIYFHFWGGRLAISFEHRAFRNDFSHWAHHCLHDDILAERLELLNPNEYENMEALRAELVEIVDNRLDEREIVPLAKSDEQFHFIRSKIIIFRTRYRIDQPSDFVKVLPLMTRSSIFFHFIEATRRIPERKDDFSNWLEKFPEQKYQNLVLNLRRIDPYFTSLSDLQQKLIRIMTNYFIEQEK